VSRAAGSAFDCDKVTRFDARGNLSAAMRLNPGTDSVFERSGHRFAKKTRQNKRLGPGSDSIRIEALGVQAMQRFPSIVPYGADQTIYLVVEASGSEAITQKTERTDIETVITELLSGRFTDPVEVLAFNTLEHWTDDLSKDIAREIRCRCDIEGQGIPAYLEEFVGRASA
jgi:hypothetical protein